MEILTNFSHVGKFVVMKNCIDMDDLPFQTQRVLVKLVVRRVLLIILWPLPTLRTVK